MTKRRLFDDMSAVSWTFVSLTQLMEGLLQKRVSLADLNEQENEASLISGLDAPHPASKMILLPFTLMFFKEVREWISRQNNGNTLVHLVKVLQGEELYAAEAEYTSNEIANLKKAPTWYTEVVRLGHELVEGKNEVALGEKVGSLLRDIPMDTTLGMLSHLFLKECVNESGDSSKISTWWAYLKGEKGLRYKVSVKGLYVWVDF